MPQRVKLLKNKEFTFKTAPSSRLLKYDWDGWFDGSLWLIERSTVDSNGNVIEKKDYDVDTSFMPPKLKTAARRRYKVVQISRLDAEGNKLEDSLIIKARPMTDLEKQDEDLLRAEEKEEAKSRRATKASAGANGSTTAHASDDASTDDES